MTADIEHQRQQQKAVNKKVAPNKPKEEIIISEEVIQQHMKDLADKQSAWVKIYFLEKGDLNQIEF